MKIVFFTTNLFGKDGWSRYSLELLREFKKNGGEAICLVNQVNEKEDIQQFPLLRPPLKYYTNPLRLFFDFQKIRNLVKRERPIIVHFLVEHYALFLPLIYFPQNRYCLTIHGTYALAPLKNWKTSFLAKFYYKKIHKIISVSNYTKEQLLRIFPKMRTKVEVIHNGINLSDSRLSFPKNQRKVIVFIGAVKERKGLKESLEALKIYRDYYAKDFVFYIIGSYKRDLYFKELEKLIKHYHLEDNVQFLGEIDEATKIEYLKKADLFLMLSKIDRDHFEGFGLVYLEANKYGVPVIGPNQAGPREAIKDGFSGYSVDVSKPVEIAKKIDLILNKNAIQRKNCLAWVKNFDIKNKYLAYEKIYKDLLKN